MDDMAGVLARAKAGDRDAMNAAITAFLPWARKRAYTGGGWPWRDKDEAFSAAMDSLWEAIKIVPDGYSVPTGAAKHLYRCRQVDELRRINALRAGRQAGVPLGDATAVDPHPGPLDAMVSAEVAAERAGKAGRIAAGFKRERLSGFWKKPRAKMVGWPAERVAAKMAKGAAATRAWRARQGEDYHAAARRANNAARNTARERAILGMTPEELADFRAKEAAKSKANRARAARRLSTPLPLAGRVPAPFAVQPGPVRPEMDRHGMPEEATDQEIPRPPEVNQRRAPSGVAKTVHQ